MKRKFSRFLPWIILVVLGLGAVGAYFFLRPQAESTQDRARPLPLLSKPAEGVIYEEGIIYQDTEQSNCILDIAYLDNGEAKPLIVFVHGGTWIAGSRKEMDEMVFTFSEKGYTAATIDYDELVLEDAYQGSCISFLDEEACVKEAVEYLVRCADQYQIDPERIVLAAHSSGAQLVGHLAEQIAVKPEEYGFSLSGTILMAPPSDLLAYLYSGANMGLLKHPLVELSFIFDGVYGTDAVPEVQKVDVMYNVNSGMDPVLIIQGNADASVPSFMSTKLHSKMLAAGVDADLALLLGVDHRLLNHSLTAGEINQFLEKLFFANEIKGD